eukprot:TRINITY_DN4043_c0_g1_i8.p2 TRINITY_DN4043_c0_g1~~TRINITY_DN4043_c0_g1_i8.p2  ORF type:complete len:170 (-),score=44.39 TRINITY_DN4043_c0_g1_i8:54-563(-)
MSTMLYADGDACASGKHRSAEVVLQCGLRPRIESMKELSCSYIINVEEPSLCNSTQLTALRAAEQAALIKVIWHPSTGLAHRHYMVPPHYTVERLLGSVEGLNATQRVSVCGTRTEVHPTETLGEVNASHHQSCLLYTSDAADEEDSVDLGGRRIIKKKKKEKRERGKE